MTRTKKALITVAFAAPAAAAAAAAIGTSVPAFANVHATDVPVTTDNVHAT
ncbi:MULTISPECIES: hypothetical protein [unclassified Streptomyces]|uniref:hypothetical protein n=1 Tax=unclassified Streptomyces TaxID=2593676 RepID=UPI001651A9D8|nr:MULTISPECIES: hypothetical protein [unclassified Streptomyces]